MFKKLFKLDEYSLMNRQMFFMFRRVLLLYFKDIWGLPKNYLDKQIYYMLDEYSYYYDLSKEWKNRK